MRKRLIQDTGGTANKIYTEALKDWKATGGKENWERIRGHFTKDEGKVLQEFANGKNCLEIGSGEGRSTICMAEKAKLVVTVDTFKAHPNWQISFDGFTNLYPFCENIEKYENIYPFIGFSEEVVPMLKDDFFDLVFVDGNHSPDLVRIDIQVSLPKLKVGGIMAFHDWGWGTSEGTVKGVVKEFFKNTKVNKIGYAIKGE